MANIIKRGKKFNYLEFLYYAEKKSKDKHLIGVFQCSCGKETERIISRVKNGYLKSCGDRIHFKGINIKHGMKGTREYNSWQSIKNRVLNKNNKSYRYYKNIKIDSDILKDFTVFFKEVGKRVNKNDSIDRIDNTKGYIKGNIRWANRSQQQTNKSTSVIVKIGDKVFKSESEAARYFKVSITTIVRWCKGYVDKRRSTKFISPKKDCSIELLYIK